MTQLDKTLFKHVDNSALVVFRICFGFLMFAEAIGAILLGWVDETFVDVKHTFTFFGFEWTDFLLGETMIYFYIIMGILGIGIMLGYRYKLSIGIFSVMWALSYFMQKSHYNNHYYLVMLVCFFMLLMPAHQFASYDVRQNRVIKSLSCPNWCILFFKLQFSIVYFYAAIAKLYPDWLQAKPVSIWLSQKTHYPIVGAFLEFDWFAYLISYGGIFFDALIIPALLFKQTRILAIVFSLIFHLFNSAVFQIGIFPYFALAVALFFFDPDKIRRVFLKKKDQFIPENISLDSIQINRPLKIFFISYFFIQVLLPIRHHFIPGNVLWNEAGHRLSWRMMLRSKSGYCTFKIEDANGRTTKVRGSEFLARHQVRDAATRPDMLYRSVDYLVEHVKENGIDPVGVYCTCRVSVNGRPASLLVDPNYNMLEAKWNYFGKQDWIEDEPDLGW